MGEQMFVIRAGVLAGLLGCRMKEPFLLLLLLPGQGRCPHLRGLEDFCTQSQNAGPQDARWWLEDFSKHSSLLATPRPASWPTGLVFAPEATRLYEGPVLLLWVYVRQICCFSLTNFNDTSSEAVNVVLTSRFMVNSDIWLNLFISECTGSSCRWIFLSPLMKKQSWKWFLGSEISTQSPLVKTKMWRGTVLVMY